MSDSGNSLSISFFSDRSMFYNNQFSFSLNLAFWVRRGNLVDSPRFEYVIDGKSVAFDAKTIQRFDPPKLRNKENLEKPNWHFYNLTTSTHVNSGWHRLEIRLLNAAGQQLSRFRGRGVIEPYGPEVTELDTISEVGSKRFTFKVARKQLPEIMQLPLTSLSEIGKTISGRFNKGGVHRIYDLLEVNPENHLIPEIHPHDVPDAVTKARILQDLIWNTSQQLSAYGLNQLALFTAAQLAEKAQLKLQRATRLLDKIREVHMVLDRSLQDDLTLSAFVPHRHTGIAYVHASLNQLDVSDLVTAEKEVYTIDLAHLEEGHHVLDLEFCFHSGNKRKITRAFTIDHSGPEIILESPAQKFIKEQDLILEVGLLDKWGDINPASVQLLVDGQVEEALNFTPTGFTARVASVSEGAHQVQVKAADEVGNATTSEVWEIIVDRTPPVVHLEQPVSPYFTSELEVLVSGKVLDANTVVVRVGEQLVPVSPEGHFETQLPLAKARTAFSVEAIDKAGNATLSEVVEVYRISEEQSAVRGMVLDTHEQSLAGVKVLEQRSGVTAWTGESGHFFLTNLPEGSLTLTITSPEIEEVLPAVVSVETFYGQVVDMGKVFLLPKGQPAEVTTTTGGRMLKSASDEGLALFIAEDTSISFPTGVEEPITLSLVDSEQLPGVLPSGIPRCKAAVFGPSGLTVVTGSPMQVTLPNELALPKGEKLLLVTLDGTTGGWSTAGVATVSEDEQHIVSEAGHGLTHFSVVLPMPPGAQIEPYREDQDVALDDAVKGGSKVQVGLPGFQLLNRNFQPRLTYSSLAAAPTVHMTAMFRGMKEITTASRVIDHVHVKKEEYVKRVEYFADYSLWLRRFRDHKGTEYYKRAFGDNQFYFVTYLPMDVTAPILPLPDSLWHGDALGPKFQWILDQQRQQEWTVRLFEIDMSLAVTERIAVWPESITGRYLFSDVDTGPFTLQGPLTPIGPEPKAGEVDTRKTYPRIPVDTLLSYHIDPRLPDGSFYPTGLYSWLGHYDIKGRSYSHIQSSQTARKGAFNYAGIEWMLANSEGQRKEELQQLFGVLQKASDLHRNGPVYASKYSYGGPLDYLINEQAGQTIIHNLSQSAFGAGWKLEEQHELIPVGRNQVLSISPEGKQVFTVKNAIRQVRPAYLEKMTYSHDGSRLLGISRTGTDWIGGNGEVFTSYVAVLVSAKAFAVRNPTKESFIRALYEPLMHEELTDEELSFWMESDVFNTDQTAQGTWNDYSVLLFIYSEKYLRYLIGDQYRTALDRDPTEEEFANHRADIGGIRYNRFTYYRDPQLHYEKLTVIITDLFFELRHELNMHDGFDWYKYVWKRLKGVEPSIQELGPMMNRIARYGRNTPDDQIRRNLYMWLAGEYWWPTKVDSLYEDLLGFPTYKDHGIRIYEDRGEKDMGIRFPTIGKYQVTTRYRSYRHPTSTNPKALFMGAQVIATSPRETYHDGPSHPVIKGMVERHDGTIFISDANANRIYLIADSFDKIPDYLLNNLNHTGGFYMASPAGLGTTLLPLPAMQYYDDQGNLIDLPEEEAMWQAAYKEWTRTTVGGAVNAMAGFTPDGKFIDDQNKRIREVAVDTPGGVVLDHKDRIIFAETGNHRVRRMDLELGELVTIAGNGEAAGYDPTVIDPLKTAIPEPLDIVISSKREMFILFHIGQGQQCIGKIDRAGFFKHMVGAPQPGTGTLDTGGDARFFKLTGATSLALSPEGELFIGLTNQHRVMVVTPDGFIDTAAGNGEAGLPNDGAPALQASLGKPVSIACDRNGNLLINDQLNKSLRIVNLALNEHESDTYFQPPLGYFEASLVQHRNGKWTKSYKNGSTVHFDRQGKHTHTADKNGNETRYLYDGDRLKEVVYPEGGAMNFSYDDQGNLLKITDHIGRKTSVQITDGRLTNLENAAGTVWEFAYDRDGRLISMNQGEESEIVYRYNDFGRLVAQTTNGKLTEIARPDDIQAGNLDQENQQALIAFQNQTTISTTGENKSAFQLEHGRLTELITNTGGTIRVSYNLQGLPEKVIRSSGSQIDYAYNDFGDLIRVEDTFTGSLIESLYDKHGRKLEEANQQGIKSFFEYDRQGNLIRSWLQHDDTSQELSHQSYDPRGLLLERQKKGVLTTYQYDSQGNLIHEQRGNLQNRFERDLAGNILSEARGHVSRTFAYDVFNQLISATEGNDQTHYQYDSRGNLIRITSPNGAEQRLSFDGRNRMTGFENANGRRWEFGFDWEDRIIKTVYPDGKELTRTWNSATEMFEDAGGQESTFTYFDVNNVRSGSNRHGIFIYELDEAGRKVKQIQVIDNTSFEVKHQVDPMSRVLQLQSPGEEVNYRYGHFGRLESMQCGSWEVQFRYNEVSGRLIGLARGNGVETRLTYDESGLVKAFQEQQSEVEVANTRLTFNEAGYPMTIGSTVGALEYIYDDKGQLSQVVNAGEHRNYTYDSIGNRLLGPEGQYTYDEKGQLLLSCPRFDYHWDELGRLQVKTDRNTQIRHVYAYNMQGQLVAYQQNDQNEQPLVDAHYAYDTMGRRIKKTVNYRDQPEKNRFQKWIYNGPNLLLELDEAEKVVRQYLCGAAQDSWLGFTEAGKVYYFQKDHLGSITGIVDETGDAMANYQYDEFGIMTASDASIANDLTYTGREYDVESGLYYYRKRHYDPALGRFIQPDEYLGNAKEPKSMINRYVYVHNNPLTFRDPSGLSPEEPGATLGDAAMWVVDVLWEILKFLLSPNGEPSSPVLGGPEGTYRDSFDMARANAALTAGYFDAKEWLAELMDQSLGKVLRELWDVIGGLFDWSTPDIELPTLTDLSHSDLQVNTFTTLGSFGNSAQEGGAERSIKVPIPNRQIRLFPVLACFAFSDALDSFSSFRLDQSEKPNYKLIYQPIFINRHTVLMIQSSIEVDSARLFLEGVEKELITSLGVTKYYEENTVVNPRYAPNGDLYWYFDVGKVVTGNWRCDYVASGKAGTVKWNIRYRQ